MAEPERLGPEELDRLEDALEGLETRDRLEDPSEVVAARLADYRAVLLATREALPPQEVPSGLLAGVLSEAAAATKGSGQASAVAMQLEQPPESGGWWARFRRSYLLPSLAVAGSAALILVLVRPQMRAAEPQAEKVAVNDTRAKSEGASPSPALASPVSDVEPEVFADPAGADPAGAPAQAAPPPASAAREAAGSASIGDVKQERIDVEPAEEKKPGGSQGWSAIERGDKARRGGDCFTARNDYSRALDDGDDAVRARAYVGMGLCKASEGNDAAAGDFFDRARELDPEALDYAGTQSSRSKRKPSAAKPSRKRARKRRKSDSPSFDPIDGVP